MRGSAPGSVRCVAACVAAALLVVSLLACAPDRGKARAAASTHAARTAALAADGGTHADCGAAVPSLVAPCPCGCGDASGPGAGPSRLPHSLLAAPSAGFAVAWHESAFPALRTVVRELELRDR